MPENSEPLKEFARWILESAFAGEDLDGSDVQEKAVELGLLREEPYSKEKHPDMDEFNADEGDPVLIMTELVK